jgi:hypothetical protein
LRCDRAGGKVFPCTLDARRLIRDGAFRDQRGMSQPAPIDSASHRYVYGAKRTAGWMLVADIQCPRGHALKDGALQIGHSTLRCKCGVMMWALFVAHSHLVFVAEVDFEDMRILKELVGLLPVLHYFEERITPVIRITPESRNPQRVGR